MTKATTLNVKQTQQVPVRREQVTVERRPVDRRPSGAPVEANSEVLRVPVREDRVSVEKQPVVYEEVNVGKRAVHRRQRVSDSVRKEVVDVDTTGDPEITGEGGSASRRGLR